MYVISALSLIGLFIFLTFAFAQNLRSSEAVLGFISLAFVLFIWSVKHSEKKKLSLAFDKDMKIEGIITSGPWKFIRHPFYVSYIAFWFACALGTAQLSSIAVFSTLLFIYVYSAVNEERALKGGRYGIEYIKYRDNAGFFLPKLVSRN
jgi:protein-S-isoprenylcysteine O-methyltransferase Ste14